MLLCHSLNLLFAGCCWGMPGLAPCWVGDQCGASSALGTRKPLERSQAWADAQEVLESAMLKGDLTPCSPGPLSLRCRQHAQCLAILAVHGAQPAWRLWLGRGCLSVPMSQRMHPSFCTGSDCR